MRAKIEAEEMKIQAEQRFEQAKAKWKRVAFEGEAPFNIENEDINDWFSDQNQVKTAQPVKGKNK